MTIGSKNPLHITRDSGELHDCEAHLSGAYAKMVSGGLVCTLEPRQLRQRLLEIGEECAKLLDADEVAAWSFNLRRVRLRTLHRAQQSPLPKRNAQRNPCADSLSDYVARLQERTFTCLTDGSESLAAELQLRGSERNVMQRSCSLAAV